MSTIAIIAWIFTIYVPAIVLAVALSQAASHEMPESPANPTIPTTEGNDR